MEEILMGILIVAGAILVIIPSQQLRYRKKVERMPRKKYWQLVLMYIIGGAMIAGGFLIGGVL